MGNNLDNQKKDPTFPNRRVVFLSIKDAGYQVSQPKLYRDCSKPGKAGGLIRVNKDGTVNESEVREYCKTLKRIEGDIDDLKDIQTSKGKLEVEKLQEQVGELRFKREKDQGKYVLKEEVDLKIISTLMVLDIHFRQLIDMNMSDICRILGGDIKKMNDAKDCLDQLLDEMMNKLAMADSFNFEIEDL